MPKKNESLRIMLLARGGTGKSNLCLGYVRGMFIDCYDPTMEDNFRKQVVVNDDTYLLDIFDTAGCEELDIVAFLQTSWCHSFLILFSITSRDSFNAVDGYVSKVIKGSNGIPPPMILVATKIDLEDQRDVSVLEAQEKVERLGMHCLIETSAKQSINVEKAFEKIVSLVKDSHLQKGKKVPGLLSPSSSSSKGCMIS